MIEELKQLIAEVEVTADKLKDEGNELAWASMRHDTRRAKSLVEQLEYHTDQAKKAILIMKEWLN